MDVTHLVCLRGMTFNTGVILKGHNGNEGHGLIGMAFLMGVIQTSRSIPIPRCLRGMAFLMGVIPLKHP